MKILAVVGEERHREALAQVIAEAAPYAQVVACENAADALARTDAGSFDAAFISIDAPDMNGVSLADKLKCLNPNMSIVFAAKSDNCGMGGCETDETGYLMKPITVRSVADELGNLHLPRTNSGNDAGRMFVRCFGEFEVFADGKAVRFERAKSKELLAFLVDRRGAVVSMRTIEAALWEEAPKPTRSTGSYLRTLIADLKRTLAACGHPDILVRRPGELGVDASRFTCDYYDYLRGDPSAINRWRNEYMAQYAWAESTRASLLNR